MNIWFVARFLSHKIFSSSSALLLWEASSGEKYFWKMSKRWIFEREKFRPRIFISWISSLSRTRESHIMTKSLISLPLCMCDDNDFRWHFPPSHSSSTTEHDSHQNLITFFLSLIFFALASIINIHTIAYFSRLEGGKFHFTDSNFFPRRSIHATSSFPLSYVKVESFSGWKDVTQDSHFEMSSPST